MLLIQMKPRSGTGFLCIFLPYFFPNVKLYQLAMFQYQILISSQDILLLVYLHSCLDSRFIVDA